MRRGRRRVPGTSISIDSRSSGILPAGNIHVFRLAVLLTQLYLLNLEVEMKVCAAETGLLRSKTRPLNFQIPALDVGIST
jgi:hypothetical protein